ncbi:MAG TPA: amidohydrolase family protein [Stellaceae bacterium]|nr:amidohydrolase family protein [Stellaceae bacterium]
MGVVRGFAGLAFAAFLLAGTPARAQVAQGLVLDGVTIVDTRDGSLSRDRAILIDRGKIQRIARAGSIAPSGAARRVDMHGKYVVPGYLDMHSHSLSAPDRDGAFALMLANGVTGYRQMSGSPELLAQRKKGKPFSADLAPELLLMPGTILTPLNAGTPQAAIAEVDRQKDEGADFIKVIDVRPDAFFAVADEAKKLGLRFLGHLPPTVNVWDATARGMRSIEHLGPKESIVLGCSTDEDAMRRAIAATPPKAPQVGLGPGLAAAVERALANPDMATDPLDFKMMQRSMETFSAAKCRKLAAAFVRNGTWQVPTLIRSRTTDIADDPRYRDDPNLVYMPAATRALWQDLAKQFPTRIPAETRAMLVRFFTLRLRLVKLFHDAGVPMMAGSDSGGAGQWDIPGFSLHQEFDLLAEAGLTPLTILQMTTLDGARFLGREATMGTVAAGKDADLVVLDANPIANERNLHRIAAVVRGGTLLSRDDLDRLLEKTKERQVAAALPAQK